MEKRVSMVLLLMAVFVLSDVADGKAKARATLSGIDRKLKLLNKPAVKSIKSEDGDIIDCVDIHKQPAFDHPALRNHKIQMRPSFDLPTEKLDRRNESSQPVIQQTWQKSGSCPEGTVPIRRIRKQDLLRAASLEQFGTKPPNILSASNKTDIKNIIFPPSINNTKLQIMSSINRSSAIMTTVGHNYVGAQGDINVRNPIVDLLDDYTTGQIWLKAGPGDNFESIEAGWAVNPKLYGDNETRLFAYWSLDSYKTTGCIDITCPGFVQTNPKLALGVGLRPNSGSGFLPIAIHLDTNKGNWWLKIGDKYEVAVGYWPKGIFEYLSHSATTVEWGGEVYSQNVKKGPPHTRTQMGSGSFGQTLERFAASILHVRIIDDSLQVKYPESVGTGSDEEYCYGAFNYVHGNNVEPVFFFGGPGQNPLCICICLQWAVLATRVRCCLKFSADKLGHPSIKVKDHSEDGDIINCVDIYKQPAFDHPALRNHKIQVNRGLYGDILTRLFVYWTKDTYRTTGCFNLTCNGFVQTSSQVALGASLGPYSVVLGPQYHITFGTYLDLQGHWWLKIGDNIIGYWPTALFDQLQQSASLVGWGGEVYSENVKSSPHTNTEMGSGSFAQTRYGSACFISNMRIQDANSMLILRKW
ncbi:hypothetical protein EZV62_013310 [Acer yangbiense]|uniref:Neprosin PEP catalytic domain-containing protein n=1 Tax=Acer yangbiense TaxID=1000413 RepID=A0A5C7HXU6_9ROSI|nr:hypothetical protein EZV62_013310 [Acer yangbiense]